MIFHTAPWVRPALLIVLLLAFTALAYWPGLGGDFLFDDYPNIVTNPRVHATELSLDSLYNAAGAYEPGSFGRPLATISFAVNYYFGGENPFGYKVTNLIVHLGNTLLVFLLVRTLLARRPTPDTLSSYAAFAVAAVWAIHPLQVSSVLYVVQRMETLSLTFVLLGLLAYLKGRRLQMAGSNGWPWLAVAALSAATGMLSKETAALFPVYTLALELTLLGFAAHEHRLRRTLLSLYAIGACVAIMTFMLWVLPRYMAPDVYAARDFSLGERLLTQLRVLPMYLGMMLLPRTDSMTFYYDNYPISLGLLDPPTTLLAGVLLLLLAGSALAARKTMPLYALGVFWFLAGHALTSNVIPLELVFEHRNYFALLGTCLAVADLILRIPTRDGPMMVRAGVASVLIGLGVLTLIRSASWSDPLLLASTLVGNNPGSSRASNDLAIVYVGMAHGDPDSPFYYFAMVELERAAQLPHASVLAEQGLILLTASLGQPVKDEWWERLNDKIATRPIGAREQSAVTDLVVRRGNPLVLDDHRLAQTYMLLVSRSRPPAYMLATFGDHAITYLKDEKLANQMFLQAVERSRKDPEFIAIMVTTLLGDGHVRQAQLVRERAVDRGIVGASAFNAAPEN